MSQTPTTTTVLLVDDHPVVARGLAAVLAGEEWVAETVVASTCAEAVEVATTHRPGLVVLDVRLADGDGIALIPRLQRVTGGCHVLVLSMDDSPDTVRRAVAERVQGYLAKSADPALILEAVRTVARGGAVLGPEMLAALAAPRKTTVPAPFDRLSPREVTLVGLVAQGMTNPLIGHRLELSEKTVRNLLSGILVKVGARDRVQLAVLAREHHLDRHP